MDAKHQDCVHYDQDGYCMKRGIPVDGDDEACAIIQYEDKSKDQDEGEEVI